MRRLQTYENTGSFKTYFALRQQYLTLKRLLLLVLCAACSCAARVGHRPSQTRCIMREEIAAETLLQIRQATIFLREAVRLDAINQARADVCALEIAREFGGLCDPRARDGGAADAQVRVGVDNFSASPSACCWAAHATRAADPWLQRPWGAAEKPRSSERQASCREHCCST